jgi:phage-related protein
VGITDNMRFLSFGYANASFVATVNKFSSYYILWYSLTCFYRKIKTPQADIDLIKQRYKDVVAREELK